LSPLLIGGSTVITIIWTFSYVRHVRLRVARSTSLKAG
jgi:hypothetical protein